MTMKNKKLWKFMLILLMSTVLLIPAPAVSAVGQKPAEWENQERAANTDGFEIENGVLKKYTGKAEHVEIPGTVTSIGDLAFSECENLKSVVIPGTVKSIGNSAFYGCETLTDVVLSEGVESIGSFVFYASGIKSVAIPGSLKKVTDSAFMACKSLKRVTMAKGVKELGSAVFNGCSSLEDVEIAETVTVIGSKAFSSCTSLKSITIPKGVRTIGNIAFQMCTKKETYEYLIRVAKQPKKYVLTDVLLETLSIIAYKQPVTKLEVEKIRGVKSDHAVNIIWCASAGGWTRRGNRFCSGLRRNS